MPGDTPQDYGDDIVPETSSNPESPREDEVPREPSGKFAKREVPPDDSDPRIPKSRFDEQVGKERALREAAERRAADLEASVARINHADSLETAIADVASLRKQERRALLDDNEDLAAQLSSKADLLNRQIAVAESNQALGSGKVSALEDMRMELTIERMESKYPQLAEGAADYDQSLVDDILDKQAGIMSREKLSASKALAKAVESVMRRIDTPSSNLRTSGGLKTAAISRNINAANEQPSSLKSAGTDSDRAGQTGASPKASSMSYDEWKTLPESTRSKLRGDTL